MPNPSRPQLRRAARRVDAHCHVFGPGAEFPYAPERKYTPCDAPKEKLFALRDFLGFDRNVIVQATCHGNDNRALVDALPQSERPRARRRLGRPRRDRSRTRGDARRRRARHALQLRPAARRFHAARRAVRDRHRIAPLGWHVVVYFEAQDLPELWDFFTTLPTTVVVDHMGRPDVGSRSTARSSTLFVQVPARASERLVESELPRAAFEIGTAALHVRS